MLTRLTVATVGLTHYLLRPVQTNNLFIQHLSNFVFLSPSGHCQGVSKLYKNEFVDAEGNKVLIFIDTLYNVDSQNEKFRSTPSLPRKRFAKLYIL